MKIVVIANPKGGSGKSTLSTNIAGYFASCGHQVMLGDADVQRSSKFWVTHRPESLPKISTWDYEADLIYTAKPYKNTTHVVIDTPGGLSGWRILVPIMPSMFDMQATNSFIVKLLQLKRANTSNIAVIGNRVDARTVAAANLKNFMDTLNVPVLSYLRDTQYYVHMAAHGLSIFDITPSKVQRDLEQWNPICQWLDSK
jgi:chromosome partitioning protein